MSETGDFVDTSLLIRYLVGEPAEMARRATAVIDGKLTLRLSLVILAETAYILQSVYKVSRPDLVDALQSLVMRRNVSLTVCDKETVVEALEMCRPSGRVSFADALLWAEACDSGRRIYTLDEKFPGRDVAVVIP
jgi:predicted nucleic acid-binding protein